MAGLETLAEGAGKLLGAVPDLYDDLAKSTVQEAGKLLSLPLEAVNALLVRPRCWIANANYRVQEVNLLIANKLKYIDENKLIPPSDYVAVPALQSLTYSMDSDELRNLYANLLAKAMNIDTKNNVHPAFVEIIRQLSPLEAALFKELVDIFYEQGKISAYDLKFENNVFHVKEYMHIVNYKNYTIDEISLAIDNLIRCNLLSVYNANLIIYDDMLCDVDALDWECVKKMNDSGYYLVNSLPNEILLTSFGKSFYSICCKDEF